MSSHASRITRPSGVSIENGQKRDLMRDLRAGLQGRFRELDAVEIYDLRERCTGCWRHLDDCARRPCGLDEFGHTLDVPPPAEAPANAEA